MCFCRFENKHKRQKRPQDNNSERRPGAGREGAAVGPLSGGKTRKKRTGKMAGKMRGKLNRSGVALCVFENRLIYGRACLFSCRGGSSERLRAECLLWSVLFIIIFLDFSLLKMSHISRWVVENRNLDWKKSLLFVEYGNSWSFDLRKYVLVFVEICFVFWWFMNYRNIPYI